MCSPIRLCIISTYLNLLIINAHWELALTLSLAGDCVVDC